MVDGYDVKLEGKTAGHCCAGLSRAGAERMHDAGKREEAADYGVGFRRRRDQIQIANRVCLSTKATRDLSLFDVGIEAQMRQKLRVDLTRLAVVNAAPA